MEMDATLPKEYKSGIFNGFDHMDKPRKKCNKCQKVEILVKIGHCSVFGRISPRNIQIE